MSVAATEVRAPAPTLATEHRPWWRSRVTLSAAIVGLMIVAYRAFGAEYPWPDSLAWNSLAAHLDDFQTWLIDQRGADGPEHRLLAVRRLHDVGRPRRHLAHGRVRLDDLARDAAAGTLVALRFGGWRAALPVLGAFASFARWGSGRRACRRSR